MYNREVDDRIAASIDWTNPDWDYVAKVMMQEFQQMDVEKVNMARRKDNVDFCVQFIKARHEKKLTQSQLAKEAGLTQSMIARLESGKISPTYKTLARVAEALDCRVTLAKR